MFKKVMALLLVIALSMTIAVGGTLAYLTDRDSEANVFTVGDVKIDLTEDFQQGATLIPGVDIEKKPVIKNTGKNDAWVWLTFSIPSALDNYIQGTETGSNENVIHWNPLGATTEGYVTEASVANAIAAGHLPEGTTTAGILAAQKTWNVFNSLDEGVNAYQEEINGVQYNTYVLLYNKALEPGETTLPNIHKVYLDAQVDIDPNGDWYKVVGGTANKLEWNSNINGNPIIYVAAYGVQTEGFSTVKEAYKAYIGQWGKLNAEYATAVNEETDLTLGGVLALSDDIALTEDKTEINAATVLNLGGQTISANRSNTSGADVCSALTVYADTTISGEGAVTNEGGYGVTLRQEGVTLTINGGNYSGEITAINVVKGTLYINGGTFRDLRDTDNGHYLINCIDDNYREGTASVVITGGSFLNWNPAANTSEGASTNFVAEGYTVSSSTDSEGTWYTVVAE